MKKVFYRPCKNKNNYINLSKNLTSKVKKECKLAAVSPGPIQKQNSYLQFLITGEKEERN